MVPVVGLDEWTLRTRRAAFASHRLIGWIYWDPTAIASYAALGVPNGTGYYIATRAAPLAAAGHQAVTAAFGSIHPEFVRIAMELCAANTTFAEAAAARDAAVSNGLRAHVPEICDELASMSKPLWDAVDRLPGAGRVLFAAHRQWPRPADDPVLSAWLAVNCIREWRGDAHWAIQTVDGLSGVAAGVLDGAWRAYEEGWLPRSRGADDAAIAAALDELDARGFVTDGRVNDHGIRHRQALEDQLDRLTSIAWQHVGAEGTDAFVRLIGSVGDRLLALVDATAGPNWMPAARTQRAAAATPFDAGAR
jgi:hypothetical protein